MLADFKLNCFLNGQSFLNLLKNSEKIFVFKINRIREYLLDVVRDIHLHPTGLLFPLSKNRKLVTLVKEITNEWRVFGVYFIELIPAHAKQRLRCVRGQGARKRIRMIRHVYIPEIPMYECAKRFPTFATPPLIAWDSVIRNSLGLIFSGYWSSIGK